MADMLSAASNIEFIASRGRNRSRAAFASLRSIPPASRPSQPTAQRSHCRRRHALASAPLTHVNSRHKSINRIRA